MCFFDLIRPPPSSPLFPYTTLFRSPRDRRTPTTADAPTGRTPSPTAAATGGSEPAADDAHHEALLGAVSDEERLGAKDRSEEHTSELQSRQYLVCRLLLEKKKVYRS